MMYINKIYNYYVDHDISLLIQTRGYTLCESDYDQITVVSQNYQPFAMLPTVNLPHAAQQQLQPPRLHKMPRSGRALKIMIYFQLQSHSQKQQTQSENAMFRSSHSLTGCVRVEGIIIL